MTMTTGAKEALNKTIRALREQLLSELHDATRSAYRLDIPRLRDAGLDEAHAARRRRLEAWLEEQVRADAVAAKSSAKDKTKPEAKKGGRDAEAFLHDVQKRAAYTLLNRLVVLRLMEASDSASGAPLRKPAVVTGGWQSEGYKALRQLAPALVKEDPNEGYAFLLQLVFEELAVDLPGLFGPSVGDLVPVPPATLRAVVDALDAPALVTCWTDDMTLGWVYQYWNDPERETLDAKLNDRKKLENHEIASKTQMFTERYMVDWLLQNSLGPMWLSICAQHGWVPEVVGSGVLESLETRRAGWRAKRENGEVELAELMPLHSDLERRWAYYVPPEAADTHGEGAAESDGERKAGEGLAAPASIRDLKLIDPAVGSGHFLVVAMDLLFALYEEEARHRGEIGQPEWSRRAIVERILEHNLHGVDLDPRAVQIAAASLWLKAQQLSPGAHPKKLGLVASALRLSGLPDDDPALVELRTTVEKETGIPPALTDTLIAGLRGADHLGSLLKIDKAVSAAIEAHEKAGGGGRYLPTQTELFREVPQQETMAFDAAKARVSLLDQIEGFLAHHTGGDDLGLRLRGEQLAAGVRFVRLLQEGRYHLVVGNPPYQGTSKMADAKYVEAEYALGKADLFAAFLMRGLQLAREGGLSALLTMRNWMFIKQYAKLREHLLANYDLRALGDFDRGAFEDVPDEVVSVVVSIFGRDAHSGTSRALCPTPREDTARDSQRTKRKRAATLCHVGRHTFDPAALKVVPEWPLVYWWDARLLRIYKAAQRFSEVAPAKAGASTGDNRRFVRRPWELGLVDVWVRRQPEGPPEWSARWVPYVMGAAGKSWIEPLSFVVSWGLLALQLKQDITSRFGDSAIRWKLSGSDEYFKLGVAFTSLGVRLRARAHRYSGVIDNMGLSVFHSDPKVAVCSLNSSLSHEILSSLNPGVHFQAGDVSRLPVFPREDAGSICEALEGAFSSAERGREPSVEFRQPGPSAWNYAQAWAQAAVDRPEGAPLPPYEPVYEEEPPTDHLSFALGVALGRFGPEGSGILDPEQDDLSDALPAGLLFLDRTLDDLGREVAAGQRALGEHESADGLFHPASKLLHDKWASHGPAVGTKRNLRDWLALDFFKDVHKGTYENRPIHWPLSSKNRTFVAWVNIHRMSAQTLSILLADHLAPARTRLEGELQDLREARQSGDAKAARAAEKRFDKVKKAHEELEAFIADVEQCADRGPLSPDPKCPPREQDHRFDPDLDDGVMINSSALWKLLEPQWKDPKKWYQELAEAKGKKDYDWSHLAMRYFPERVDAKCRKDPSLGVAHGCFWRYHPARAWAWELRLQDEIGPDFKIEEPPYRPGGHLPPIGQPTGLAHLDEGGDEGDAPHRARHLTEQAPEALEAIEKEAIRRMGRGTKQKLVPEMRILEEGFWAALPEAVHALELRLSKKQGAEFRLLAPDEPEARPRFEAEHPEEAERRRQLLADLVPATLNLDPTEALDEDDPEDADRDDVA